MTSLDIFRTAIESLERYCRSTNEGTECSTITGDIAHNHNADGSSYDIAFTNERGANFRLACRTQQPHGPFDCSFTQYIRMLTAGCGGGNAGSLIGYTDTFEVKNPDGQLASASGCTKSDHSNLTAGSVTFIGRNTSGDDPGQNVTAYDTCKGGNLLIERTCEGYHGPDTLQSELKLELWECECVEGACVEGTVKTCHDPEEEHYDGKSVWTEEKNGVTKRYYSDCPDERSVRYVYCNPNGSFHADVLACSFNQLCADGMCGGFHCEDDKAAGIDPEGHQPPGTLTFTNPTTDELKTLVDECWTWDNYRQLACPIATSANFESIQQFVRKQSPLVDCLDGEWCPGLDQTVLCKPKPADDPHPMKCLSDTDPNNDPYLGGTVTIEYTESGTQYLKTDECSGGSGSATGLSWTYHLRQYACDPATGSLVEGEVNCAKDEICYDGDGPAVCFATQCSYVCDEKAYDIYTGGTTHYKHICDPDNFTARSASGEDWCAFGNPKQLQEFWCDNGVPTMEIVTCPPDYYCTSNFPVTLGGYCAQCTDTDKPDSPGVAGLVSDVKGQQGGDFCTTDGKLKQASCDDAGQLSWSDPLPCPPGQSCAAGACH